MIYNQDLERKILGGLINKPDVYPEFANFLTHEDFFYEINSTIYKVVKNILDNQGTVDRTIVVARIKDYSLTFEDNIEIDKYIDDLVLEVSSHKAIIQCVRDLKKISYRRTTTEMAQKMIREVKKNPEWKIEEINGFVERLVYENMKNWGSDGEIIDLFDGFYEEIEKRALDPREEVGMPSPYGEFNRLYGGFKPGDVYVFAARPGEGKSTFLTYTAFEMANIAKNKIPCLILDTEMGQDKAVDVKYRIAAFLTGINPWYFSTGNWVHDEGMVDIVRNQKKNGLNLEERVKDYKMYYRYITNATIDNIIITIKKWYYTVVGRGNPCIIVYDYLKISGENLSMANKEHQVMGNKVDRLKELVGKEINAPLLTAIQLNRSGDNRSSNFSDDSTAIATSDRVLWFGTYVGILRTKTTEEIKDETYKYGGHKLISLKTRFQGKDAAGHDTFVKNHKGKLVHNFLNFSMKNFQVKEKVSAEKMYQELSGDGVTLQIDKEEEEEESDSSFFGFPDPKKGKGVAKGEDPFEGDME